MSRQGSRDTSQELAVRRLLHASGLRYRVNVPVPGMPRRTIDIVFGPARVAVFLDGCFWHGCPGTRHSRSPTPSGGARSSTRTWPATARRRSISKPWGGRSCGSGNTRRRRRSRRRCARRWTGRRAAGFREEESRRHRTRRTKPASEDAFLCRSPVRLEESTYSPFLTKVPPRTTPRFRTPHTRGTLVRSTAWHRSPGYATSSCLHVRSSWKTTGASCGRTTCAFSSCPICFARSLCTGRQPSIFGSDRRTASAVKPRTSPRLTPIMREAQPRAAVPLERSSRTSWSIRQKCWLLPKLYARELPAANCTAPLPTRTKSVRTENRVRERVVY